MPRTSVAVGVQIGSATVTTAFSKEGFRSAIQGLRRDLDRDMEREEQSQTGRDIGVAVLDEDEHPMAVCILRSRGRGAGAGWLVLMDSQLWAADSGNGGGTVCGGREAASLLAVKYIAGVLTGVLIG